MPHSFSVPDSYAPSLDRLREPAKIAVVLSPGAPNVKPCRYEHTIAGRTYVIEVSPVSATRWRAQIARLPGMPTSLMPFYGVTPEEAALSLTNWLSLVSKPSALAPQPASGPARPGPAATRHHR